MADPKDIFKWAKPVVPFIFPGQAGVYSNFQGYKQMIKSGADKQKDLSTYLLFTPLSALAKGIG